MGLFGNFSQHGWGGLPNSQNLKPKKNALKSPKKQTKFFTKSPKKFHLNDGFPKWGGWGSDVWEKFPNNPVFFFEGDFMTRISPCVFCNALCKRLLIGDKRKKSNK